MLHQVHASGYICVLLPGLGYVRISWNMGHNLCTVHKCSLSCNGHGLLACNVKGRLIYMCPAATIDTYTWLVHSDAV